MTYREATSKYRKPKAKEVHSGDDDDDDNAALIGADHAEQSGAVVERPAWMAFIDEANVDLDTIKTKREEESKHKREEEMLTESNFFFPFGVKFVRWRSFMRSDFALSLMKMT
jgi:hypothetical protein